MYFIRKYYGHSVLAALSIVPVFLWLQHDGLSTIVSRPGTFTASLGKATALIGTTLFVLMPILSMRHQLVSRLFGGISNAYSLHSLGGKVSFFLIIAHPILLGLGRMLDGTSFVSVWDWWSWLVLSGVVALLVLCAVTYVTVLMHIRHQQWVWVHRIFGWLIPLFIIHGLLARNKLFNISSVFLYIGLLSILGFFAFLYRSVLSRKFIKQYTYEVQEINSLTEEVIELVLRPKGIAMPFTPGQFAFVSFITPGVDSEAHPFSFSNAHDSQYLRFTIKALGDDTRAMRSITKGAIAMVEGPFGDFSYLQTRNRKQVWIAGGIGITPFLSMARSFSGNREYEVHFFYGTDTLEEAVYLQEFMDITRHVPKNFRTSVVSRNISGFVTVGILQKSLHDLQAFDYFVCGPPPMMAALKSSLITHGVPEEQIHIESFNF